MEYKVKVGGETKRSRFAPILIDVDWDKVHPAAKEFITRFGLRQTLANATIGAENQDQFNEAAKGYVERLYDGSAGSRVKGETKPDTAMSRALKNARAFVRAQLKTANKTAESEAIAAGAKLLVERSRPVDWLAEAKAQIEAEKLLAEKAGQAAGDDILAGLGLAE